MVSCVDIIKVGGTKVRRYLHEVQGMIGLLGTLKRNPQMGSPISNQINES
jgi:hypothetical protein